MDEPQNPTPPVETAEVGLGMPGGDHPLEVGARIGLGPLSPLAREIWHGHARPCVSCGQLVRRKADYCDSCGQDLSEDMLEKMRAHCGPWYVLEHLRPFPGVSLERIIRQVRRGLITQTSIVRGPSTDYQWRFAVETPGLCRYFGKCWNCHEEASTADIHCRHCLADLTFEVARTPASEAPPAAPVVGEPAARAAVRLASSPPDRTAPPIPPTEPVAVASERDLSPPSTGSEALQHLSAAVNRATVPTHGPVWDDPPRLGGIRATWIAAGLIIVVIVVLMIVAQSRVSGPVATTPATGVSTTAR